MKQWWRRLRCRVGWHKWWKTGDYQRACMRCNAKQFDLKPVGGGWEYYDV